MRSGYRRMTNPNCGQPSRYVLGGQASTWRKRLHLYGYAFIAPFFAGFIIFHLYPIVYSLYLSFTDWQGYGSPIYIGSANYARLLGDPVFYKSLTNTLVIWIISIVPQLSLALVLALILSEKFVRGKHFFRAVFYFPNLVTPVSIGVLFSLLFDWQTGVANKALLALHLVGVPVNWLGDPFLSRILVAGVICWQWFGYNMLLYLAGLQSVPDEIVEAAKVDGANSVQVATRIQIPLLRPVILFTLITSIIGGMQIFDVPYLLTGVGPDNSTLTIVMYLYNTAFKDSRYGYASTIAYSTFVLIALLSMATFRLGRSRR